MKCCIWKLPPKVNKMSKGFLSGLQLIFLIRQRVGLFKLISRIKPQKQILIKRRSKMLSNLVSVETIQFIKKIKQLLKYRFLFIFLFLLFVCESFQNVQDLQFLQSKIRALVMSDQQSNPFGGDRSQSFEQQSIHEQIQDEFIDNQIPVQETDFFQIYGMFFCATCKNMIEPYKTNGDLLQFKCKRCPSMSINFRNRADKKCLLYSKALQQGSRRTIPDPNFIFDPTMPRMIIQCPQCQHDQAIYIVTPDQGQRKMVVKLICLSGADQGIIKCGNQWDLDQDTLIFKDTIRFAGSNINIQSDHD